MGLADAAAAARSLLRLRASSRYGFRLNAGFPAMRAAADGVGSDAVTPAASVAGAESSDDVAAEPKLGGSHVVIVTEPPAATLVNTEGAGSSSLAGDTPASAADAVATSAGTWLVCSLWYSGAVGCVSSTMGESDSASSAVGTGGSSLSAHSGSSTTAPRCALVVNARIDLRPLLPLLLLLSRRRRRRRRRCNQEAEVTRGGVRRAHHASRIPPEVLRVPRADKIRIKLHN